MEIIKALFKKLCNNEVISYLIFGVLTTLVNIVSFYVFVHIIDLEENLSNTIAIILSILFAYITNSKFVFKSKFKFSEFIKFILGRGFTFIFEVVGFFLLFNILHITDITSKTIVTIIVIILNYFISKFFAFKK